VVESEAHILRDSRRLIETWHDPSRGALLQIAVAPCSPFSVSPSLMRESAALARSYGVRLHTHLAENDHDVAYTRERFNCTPAEYAESLGWLGDDVWHAHCVKLDPTGMKRFAQTRTGVAHCPCSNMRLASGILPLRAMLDSGVPVGLGVDGSASNDAGHLLNEARQAMLLARVRRSLDPMGCDTGPQEMTPRDALRLATRGGAEVLGRTDIGQITPGCCADFALYRLDTLALAGAAVHDPVGALLLCSSGQADMTIVHGEVLVREGRWRRAGEMRSTSSRPSSPSSSASSSASAAALEPRCGVRCEPPTLCRSGGGDGAAASICSASSNSASAPRCAASPVGGGGLSAPTFDAVTPAHGAPLRRGVSGAASPWLCGGGGGGGIHSGGGGS
jgi:cytosine/adenosine deaminase-related metal-dependent hydrolase